MGTLTTEIRREYDPEFLDRIANDPAVRPFVVYHDNAIDWTPALDTRSVFFLSNGRDAVGVFEWTGGDQEFQVHTLFMPSCRGADAVRTGKAMLDWAFDHGAKRIWGRTPMRNKAARMFNRLCGAKVVGHDTSLVEGPVEIFEVVR